MARLRVVLFLALTVLAYLALRPLVADAHIVEHDRLVILHDVTIPADETVDGDVTVILGNVHVAGHVRGDVNTLLGRCVVTEGAEIDGESHCVTDGGPRWITSWLVNSLPLASLSDQNRHVMFMLRANAIVLLVFLLFPVRMRLALDRVERHPGISALVGILAAVFAIPIFFLLLLSVIGIPLIALEAVALPVGIWLGTGALALLVGRRLSELVMPRITPSPLWALILGLVVVSAAETIPVVGWIVTGLVWLVGLGAAILAFTGSASAIGFRATSIGGPPMPTRPV